MVDRHCFLLRHNWGGIWFQYFTQAHPSNCLALFPVFSRGPFFESLSSESNDFFICGNWMHERRRQLKRFGGGGGGGGRVKLVLRCEVVHLFPRNVSYQNVERLLSHAHCSSNTARTSKHNRRSYFSWALGSVLDEIWCFVEKHVLYRNVVQ